MRCRITLAESAQSSRQDERKLIVFTQRRDSGPNRRSHERQHERDGNGRGPESFEVLGDDDESNGAYGSNGDVVGDAESVERPDNGRIPGAAERHGYASWGT